MPGVEQAAVGLFVLIAAGSSDCYGLRPRRSFQQFRGHLSHIFQTLVGLSLERLFGYQSGSRLPCKRCLRIDRRTPHGWK